jgi:nucleoside 2-deoxyribosyltransferase
MKLYLAGPITGKSWEEATEWRNWITQEIQPLGIQVYSPLRFKNYLSHLDKLDDSYEQFTLSTGKGITTRDRWDATRCDVLLVNFLNTERVSIGTVMEIAWADSKRIPIIVVMEPDNVHMHAMILESVGFIVKTLEEAVICIKALLMED